MKKNKYSTPLWMLATILAGMLSPKDRENRCFVA
ncbi:hypothetical protein G884_01754 [Escherichia coli KOEGE 40 (102a)]|nr:hypothetical protein G884_01754 [Escherichia coli KOEGE 40 (102a)]